MGGQVVILSTPPQTPSNHTPPDNPPNRTPAPGLLCWHCARVDWKQKPEISMKTKYLWKAPSPYFSTYHNHSNQGKV